MLLDGNVYKDTLFIGDTLNLDINVIDPDILDYIRIESPVLEELEALGMVINLLEGIPSKSNISNIFWSPICSLLGVTSIDFQQTIIMKFIAKDPPYCFRLNTSEITIELLVKMPDNQVPKIFDLRNNSAAIDKSYNESTQTFNLIVNAGELIEFDILGYDFDEDSIDVIITGIELGMELGQPFYENDDLLFKKYPFSWQTSCANLNGLDDATFKIKLIIQDSQLCRLISTNEYYVEITVKDKLVARENMLFANAFTPNDDNKNQTFFLDNDKIINNNQRLPEDNCSQQFLKIEIYNRWEEQIFESDNRKFEWEGKNLPAGIYYYVIYYSKQHYKGTITLLR